MFMPLRGNLITLFNLGALLFAGPALAQPPIQGDVLPKVPQALAIAQVQVVAGGLPAEDVKDGIVFSPDLGSDCLPKTQPQPKTLAGVLGTTMKVEVSVTSCVKDPPVRRIPAAIELETTCGWALTPARINQAGGSMIGFAGTNSCGTSTGKRSFGRQSFTGTEGTIEFAVPDTVGAYRLDLNCTRPGQGLPAPFTALLFAIYQPPLTVVMPPRKSWYALSTCWATGHGRDSSEADVLSSLIKGIYSYGENLWYYGYAQAGETEGTYSFPSLSNDTGKRVVEYTIEDEQFRPKCNNSSICKCYWQGLVEHNPVCNFSDCYIFSDVLQAMAAVQGIGGLRYFALTGEQGLGFVTNPSQSLDPKFTGSVACVLEGQTCYPYYFASHSLRLRDNRYYDSTFGQVYDSPNEGIGLSEMASQDDFILLSQAPEMLALRALGKGYGNWHFYGAMPAAPLIPPEPEIVVEDQVTFSPSDTNGDGVYEYLIASLSATIKVGGIYTIRGVLEKNDKVVAIQPNWWATEPTVATVSGPPGKYTFELYFSGQQIFQSGSDGPYDFYAIVSEREDPLELPTAAYSHQQFGELGAAIQNSVVDVVEYDSDGDDKPDELQIVVPLKVWLEGTYTLEARLAKGDQTIAYTGEKEKYEVGQYRVELIVPGQTIADEGLDSPYGLTVVLYDQRQMAQIALQQTVEDVQASDFE